MHLLIILELIGTIAFAISGAIVGMQKHMDIFGVAILWLTTAVGGGLLRDIFAGQTPYIFVKHFYACASIIGAWACVLPWRFLGENTAMFIGAASIGSAGNSETKVNPSV